MQHATRQPQKKGLAMSRSLTAFSFLFCLIMLERTLARDCPSLSNRQAGTAPSGVLSSFFCLVFLCSCILMLQRYKTELSGSSLGVVFKVCFFKQPAFIKTSPVSPCLYSRLLHLDLLCMSLFVVQFGLQTNHLPGFVGPLMGLTALLLPLLFMVVQAVAMPLAM